MVYLQFACCDLLAGTAARIHAQFPYTFTHDSSKNDSALLRSTHRNRAMPKSSRSCTPYYPSYVRHSNAEVFGMCAASFLLRPALDNVFACSLTAQGHCADFTARSYSAGNYTVCTVL